MRSFAILALLFTSVFAAPLDTSSNSVTGAGKGVSSSPASAVVNAAGQAAHVPRAQPAVPNLPAPASAPGESVPSTPAAKAPSTSELTTRSSPCSIACILNEVADEIEPLLEELIELVPLNATVAIVTPILESITDSLLAAVPKLEALVGTEVSELLVDIDGLPIAVEQLAKIVFDALVLVFKALAKVLEIIDSQPGQIFDLLVKVLQAVFAILQAVVQLVGSIVASLGPLVAEFVALIDCLGVTAILQLLNISS
ncbi:hypothetical protein EDD16DRAFT_1701376 [Pisolithus croceorrhizus]|nr:hypothetical protein EDD16DRAFT_1701376 [Pisolithus croceorrhizus]KAI6135854.1 hypothetical protein EV401DRAFT_1898730 [Pisolithus croceorrhizus]KAI6169600.1 hypothetical protein EDD17DRAFT_1519859 [Pisolithus thermaeus]